MSFNKIGITKPSFGLVHPFKVDIGKNGQRENGNPIYTLAVNFHSGLFSGMKFKDRFLSYERQNITGLDFPKEVPSTFPGKNFYCLLKIKIKDLSIDTTDQKPAEIIWVEGDDQEELLSPVTFESPENLRQIEARIIIGVLIADDEALAGLPANESAVKTAYFMQYINTHLIMCNMVFDGIPIIYPVPFSGGRLNDGSFE
jgi:hypothetical protein